jgi:hypothetical protein
MMPYNENVDECSLLNKIFTKSCEQKKSKTDVEKLKGEIERQRIRNECIKDLPVKSGPIADRLC